MLSSGYVWFPKSNQATYAKECCGKILVKHLKFRRTWIYLFQNFETQQTSIPQPVLVENWPQSKHEFGQITSVSIDPVGNPVIFHRGERVWDANTRDYDIIQQGPISSKTIIVLNSKTGDIEYGWGDNMFYMPHGLTIDVHGNYWMTDVILHQVFKVCHFHSQYVMWT